LNNCLIIRGETEYYDNRRELVTPYITGNEVGADSALERTELIDTIALLLDCDDDYVIELLGQSDQMAFGMVRDIRLADAAVKQGFIKQETPWLGELQDKMLRFTVYAANAAAEMDLKKGERETRKAEEGLGGNL
jgi:hypothetical protein